MSRRLCGRCCADVAAHAFAIAPGGRNVPGSQPLRHNEHAQAPSTVCFYAPVKRSRDARAAMRPAAASCSEHLSSGAPLLVSEAAVSPRVRSRATPRKPRGDAAGHAAREVKPRWRASAWCTTPRLRWAGGASASCKCSAPRAVECVCGGAGSREERGRSQRKLAGPRFENLCISTFSNLMTLCTRAPRHRVASYRRSHGRCAAARPVCPHATATATAASQHGYAKRGCGRHVLCDEIATLTTAHQSPRRVALGRPRVT